MQLSSPEALNKGHLLKSFTCGSPSLDDWLIRYARQAHTSGSARTFVVTEAENVVGYYSLTVGQIEPIEAPPRIQKGMGRHPIPVIILARLAVSKDHQGLGIGRGLLQDAIRRALVIAEQAGIRALLTHPIDENATNFYRRFGFVSSPLREQQFLLLLKDARRLLTDSP
ncbi:GCN5-related N-acetyltransferase [Desulfosarcina variabilis str. Montpellier]|uniref:GNAT family N-acetyltransferase n=1 Tax=Desulfosarcina variabilis TaxID=2300 RepID=UPI003AFA35DF